MQWSRFVLWDLGLHFVMSLCITATNVLLQWLRKCTVFKKILFMWFQMSQCNFYFFYLQAEILIGMFCLKSSHSAQKKKSNFDTTVRYFYCTCLYKIKHFLQAIIILFDVQIRFQSAENLALAGSPYSSSKSVVKRDLNNTMPVKFDYKLLL